MTISCFFTGIFRSFLGSLQVQVDAWDIVLDHKHNWSILGEAKRWTKTVTIGWYDSPTHCIEIWRDMGTRGIILQYMCCIYVPLTSPFSWACPYIDWPLYLCKINDFVYISDNEYTREQILDMVNPKPFSYGGFLLHISYMEP